METGLSLRTLLFALTMLAISLIGCQSSVQIAPLGQVTLLADLGEFTKNAVTVSAQLVQDENEQMFVQALFSPEQSNWHLYSKDLPLKGIEGAGRPTLLSIQSPEIEVMGTPAVDVEPYEIEFAGFDEPFSIYPDGPVLLSIPIQFAEDGNSPSMIDLSVTYMACSSDGTCKPPVEDYQFSGQISSDAED